MLSSSVFVNAQKSKVTSAANYLNSGKLDKAKETIDKGITHAKCAKWAKAYLVKGKIYQGIFENPLEAYSKLSDDALNIAYTSYNKALEVDKKGKIKKAVKIQFTDLIIDFTNDAVVKFNDADYEGALYSFEKILEIENLDFMKTKNIDSAIVYNAALAAQKCEKYKIAIKYFNKAIKISYESARSYVGISSSYKALGEEDKAVEYLHKGFELFPNNTYMLFELINFYLLGGEPQKAEKYLEKAIELDPENGSLYRAKGSLYERMKDSKKAAKMYIKALELSPEDYLSQYNLGNVYLNDAIELHKKVNEISDVKEYNKGMISVFSKYEEAIPYFEKVIELKNDDKNSLIVLKELYFKLRNENEIYLKKYNDTKLKLEKM